MSERDKIREAIAEKLTISPKIISNKHDLRKHYYFNERTIEGLIKAFIKEFGHTYQNRLEARTFKTVGDLFSYFAGEPFEGRADEDHVAIRVKRLIAEKAGMGFKAIHDDFLIEDLGLDSVDMVELSMQIEEEFDVDASNSMRIEGWANITTVRQAINITIELIDIEKMG